MTINTPEVRAWLRAIGQRNNGVITPEAVVEAAKDPASPGYALFEWDVKAAAYENWINRAREIIRTVRVEERQVVRENVMINVGSYVHDPRLPEKTAGYVTTTALRLEPKTARDALAVEILAVKLRFSVRCVLQQSLGLKAGLKLICVGLSTQSAAKRSRKRIGLGMVGRGTARFGVAWLGTAVEAWCGAARPGEAGHGGRGLDRRGLAAQGGQGKVWFGV